MELLILLVVALGAFMAFVAGIALLVIYLRASRAPAGPVYAPRPRPADGAICPRCGAGNPPGTAVCRRCGASLVAASPRPSPPPAAPAPSPQPRVVPQAAAAYAPGAGSRPADMPRAWLEGVGGTVSGQRFGLQKADTLVGRSTVCDVQIPDPKVSRRHFMIRFARGAFFLQDQQSAQGTWVNGERVLAQRLRNGDRITVGDTTLIFRAEG
ncbi:MAG: hypothetical protein Kow00106_05170 [Anaerolineae bacterium]